jgi:hypothetical protein
VGFVHATRRVAAAAVFARALTADDGHLGVVAAAWRVSPDGLPRAAWPTLP